MPISQPSVTPASQDDELRRACAEAVDELKAARKLLASQGVLIEKQNELLALEGKLSTGLKDLRTLDADEKAELRTALAAKDRQIAAVEAQIVVLKKNQVTAWKKLKWIIIGGAAGIIAGTVLNK